MKFKHFFILISILCLSSTVVFAEENLSAEQVKELFYDKTFDGHNETKNKTFKGYSSPDGKMFFKFKSGKKKKKFSHIDDKGRHCVSKKKNKPGRCSYIVPMGNGVYHKITMGVHTHTLKNFVDGKHL